MKTTNFGVEHGADIIRGRTSGVAAGPNIDFMPWKLPVVAASTANGTLATAFEAGDTLDGITLAEDDRILLRSQTAGAENGIYVVQASGTPLRSDDMDASDEFPGAAVYVVGGTVNIGRTYICTNISPPTVDTDPITFALQAFGGIASIGDAEGAIAIRYTFSTTTTDSDPGLGLLRLSNATQYSAVTVRCDLQDAGAADVTNLLDLIGLQTGTTLGYLRLQKSDDPTKWLLATVSAIATPGGGGYRNVTIANIAKSANSPFANGDAVTLVFVPSTVGLATISGSISPSVLIIPGATSPAQTAEGSAVWDTDDDVLTVGDGASRSTFGKLGSTNAAAVGTAAAGSSKEGSRVDHVHPTGAGTPTTSAVADAAATGSGPAAAMTNHVHGREAFGTPVAIGAANAAGSATTVSHSDHVHSGLGGGSGSALFGNAIVIAPLGLVPSGTQINAVASRADLLPIFIPSVMLLRAFVVRVTTGAAGTTNQWGLFRYDSDPTSATKVAGGTGALSTAGWQSLDAAGGPITIAPGFYVLIFLKSAATPPTLAYSDGITNIGHTINLTKASYTWSNTPDLTGWSSTSIGTLSCYLLGDYDGSHQY